MRRRFLAVILALFMLLPAFCVPAYADDPAPVATFIQDLATEPEALYTGSSGSWPYEVKLKFTSAANAGTVTYQWYRAVGDDPAEGDFVADTRPGSSGTAAALDSTTFSTGEFYRDTTAAGAFTYYVVFTNTMPDSSTETFESNHRVTYVAPQVLYMKSQTYTSDVVYYFQGSPATELSITLGLPADTPEFAESSYGTNKYQWYKSTVAYSPFVYDDFPFFDETETPAIAGASGTIAYADAAIDAATITYTPVNNVVGGPFYYWPFVYDESNGVISYTPNIMDAVIEVLPSPVTSIVRNPASATVHIGVTLPTGRTVDSDYQYLLVPQGTDPGATPAYTTAELGANDSAILSFTELNQGAYDLYLVFTDDLDEEWPYKATVPVYYDDYTPPSTGTPIDAGTTDGAAKAKGTMTTTTTGTGVTTTVKITGESFGEVTAQALESGTGIRVETPNARITFDNKAVRHFDNLGQSGDVELEVGQVDTSALSTLGLLSEEDVAVIGDRPVYDFSLAIGGTRVSSFDGGSAAISIPYTLAPDENPDAVVVYYIDDDGNLVAVRGAYNTGTGTVDFTVTHFSYYAVGYNPVSFSDVAAGDWYYEATTFIAARGITTGAGGDLFAPNASITRGQFVTMLLRAYGIDPDASPADNFSDAGNTYYTNYLATAKRLGITGDTDGNLFAPDSGISRQDMFTLLYQALGALGELPEATGTVDLSSYSDGSSVAAHAEDAFESLMAAGIVKGSGGRLRPADMATRAEMAAVLYGLLSA